MVLQVHVSIVKDKLKLHSKLKLMGQKLNAWKQRGIVTLEDYPLKCWSK